MSCSQPKNFSASKPGVQLMDAPAANEALDAEAVRARFAELATLTGRTPEDVADGFIRIAVQQMANAIKKISVARGYDVTRYTLQCFGGAGGQHACLVADALGMTRTTFRNASGLPDPDQVTTARDLAVLSRAVMRDYAALLSTEMQQVAPEAAISFEPLVNCPPFESDADSSVRQHVDALCHGCRGEAVAYTTEAGRFAEAGIAAVVCGPGSIEQAHRPDEYVELGQLALCRDWLLRLTGRCSAQSLLPSGSRT